MLPTPLSHEAAPSLIAAEEMNSAELVDWSCLCDK